MNSVFKMPIDKDDLICHRNKKMQSEHVGASVPGFDGFFIQSDYPALYQRLY